MIISGSGNVGVGTPFPASRFHVDGADYCFIAGFDAGNRRVTIGLNSVGEPSIQGTLSNGTARQLSINPLGGNVLIGTTTDAGYKLDVNGTTRLSGTLTIESLNQVSRFVSSNTVLYNTYRANSVDVGYIGNGEGLISGGTATSFGIRAEADFLIAIGNVSKFTMSSTGYSTFSGAIAIGNNITSSAPDVNTHKVEIEIGGNTYYLLATENL
jgi:hypothetical protein